MNNRNLIKVLIFNFLFITLLKAMDLSDDNLEERSGSVLATHVVGSDEKANLESLKDLLHKCSLDQKGINRALMHAAKRGHLTICEYLLNLPTEKMRPSQGGINWVFREAARNNYRKFFNFMLEHHENLVTPNQVGVNRALVCASGNDQQELVDILLNQREERLRPDQNGIIDAYRDAYAYGHFTVAALLDPYLPIEDLQNQINPDGIAFEIHNYAETLVTSSIAKSSKTNTLIDAVFQEIEKRTDKLISYSEAKAIVDQAIDSFIPKAQQVDARQAVFYRLASDYDYEQKLRVAVTFIQLSHPDKMEQWIVGFVNESIDAYRNSSNPLSCSKGICERIATGLRGIDVELDKLFVQAEAPMLVKNWLKAWTLSDLKDDAKQELVTQLKTKGITSESSAADAANAFREIAKEQLSVHGISENEELLETIEVYAESMIEANYEKELKHLC